YSSVCHLLLHFRLFLSIHPPPLRSTLFPYTTLFRSMQKTQQPLPKSIRRTAILLTLGISLHNFPEGIATFVTASSNLELGMGIADRKSTRLNSSHVSISYAVFCLKKKK